jgi:hypothetical protein
MSDRFFSGQTSHAMMNRIQGLSLARSERFPSKPFVPFYICERWRVQNPAIYACMHAAGYLNIFDDSYNHITMRLIATRHYK